MKTKTRIAHSWLPGEPNNYENTNERCVEIIGKTGYYGLNDCNCEQQIMYICEMNPIWGRSYTKTS